MGISTDAYLLYDPATVVCLDVLETLMNTEADGQLCLLVYENGGSHQGGTRSRVGWKTLESWPVVLGMTGC